MLLTSGILWGCLSLVSLGTTYEYNEDPARADPLHAITCDGPLPLFRYVAGPGGDDTSVTIQKLCAQAQYGGYPRGYNAGAYCSKRNTLFPTSSNSIDFELRLDGSDNTGMKLRSVCYFVDFYDRTNLSTRLAFYCQLRCNYSGIEQSGQAYLNVGKSLYNLGGRTIDLPDLAQLKLDTFDQNDPETLEEHRRYRKLSQTVDTGHRKFSYGDEYGRPRIFEEESYHHLYLRPEHEIECEGNLPTFDLPAMNFQTQFNDPTHLCAVTLSGGNE